MDFTECIDCPPEPLAILIAFGVGALLVVLALVARRRLTSPIGRALIPLSFLAALCWNLLLVFSFVYPHNHHVVYLSSHRASLVANAAIGLLWLAAVVIAFTRYWRGPRRAA